MLQLQLLTAFIIGGLFIALQTLVAERVPDRWKGIILTIPSTLALGLFFIGFTKTALDVPEAVIVVPAGLGITYIFVAIFALLINFGLVASFAGSLSIWAGLAYLLLRFTPETFLISTIYGTIGIIIAYLMVMHLPKIPRLKQFPLNPRHIAIRSLIGGTIIALIVFLANTLGNIWGGIFSVFPAAYCSAFIIYYYMQGKQSIPAVGRSFFFPGIFGFFIYAWISKIIFPIWGIWLGTLAAYLTTFAFFWLWTIVKKQIPLAERKQEN